CPMILLTFSLASTSLLNCFNSKPFGITSKFSSKYPKFSWTSLALIEQLTTVSTFFDSFELILATIIVDFLFNFGSKLLLLIPQISFLTLENLNNIYPNKSAWYIQV